MIQCTQCEFFVQGANGQFGMTCNPFATIKEPECLAKLQLVKLDMMVSAYQATIRMYERLAPLQEKMFKHMQREIQEMDEADSWRTDDPQDEFDPGDEPEDENRRG